MTSPDLEPPLFVLVGGWPGAGKSTLSAALARELGSTLLAKDEIKEALAEALGQPESVEASRRLGRAAVLAMLRAALRCRGAVLDSTWYPYTLPLVRALPGRVVEVRCVVPAELARTRYRSRAAGRQAGHLDALRTDDELWSQPVAPLGVGPLVTVDTSGEVDLGELASRLRTSAGALPRQPLDLETYERRSREGPCFVCETLAGNPDYPHDILWMDDHAVAFLARFTTLLGHTLVAPRAHRERVTADFGIDEYLALQRLVHRVGEAVRREVPTERLYLMSLGSLSGNRHVHWHVAPLPPGVPYAAQQFAAFSPERGVVALPKDEIADLARRIRRRIEQLAP